MKWSLYTEKGKFTREVRGKHKVILKFIENGPKNIKVQKSFSSLKHKGKWQNVFPVL